MLHALGPSEGEPRLYVIMTLISLADALRLMQRWANAIIKRSYRQALIHSLLLGHHGLPDKLLMT